MSADEVVAGVHGVRGATLQPLAGIPGALTADLPTPTVQCHAANLHRLPGGDLACVWFGGTQEGVADIRVHLSRLPAGSDTWGEPVVLSDDDQRSEQNPVLFTAPSGEVWLLYTAQLAGNQDTAQVRRRISRDGGQTWAEPTVLIPAREPDADGAGGRGVFVRQPPVALPNGRLLLGVFSCVTPPTGRWVGDLDTSSVMWSDDGDTWHEVAVPESTGCVHLGVVPRADGTLWGYMRSRWADHVWQTSSADGGASWAAATPTELPNNNSSVQAVGLGDGVLAMVYNHASVLDATQRRVSLYDEIDDEGVKDDLDGPVVAPEPTPVTEAGDEPEADATQEAGGRTAYWGAPRAPMSLGISTDDGRSWTGRLDVETGDGYCMSNNSRDGVNRELSYPSVLPGPDGSLDLAYTWHRRVIRHVRLPAQVVAGLVEQARHEAP